MPGKLIYHICQNAEWDTARQLGIYNGSSQDLSDGFIHFSTRVQVRASAAKHRSGQDGLMLLSVNPDTLGAALKWEYGKKNQLFPHLYGKLSIELVLRADPLRLDVDGFHIFPPGFPKGKG